MRFIFISYFNCCYFFCLPAFVVVVVECSWDNINIKMRWIHVAKVARSSSLTIFSAHLVQLFSFFRFFIQESCECNLFSASSYYYLWCTLLSWIKEKNNSYMCVRVNLFSLRVTRKACLIIIYFSATAAHIKNYFFWTEKSH